MSLSSILKKEQQQVHGTESSPSSVSFDLDTEGAVAVAGQSPSDESSANSKLTSEDETSTTGYSSANISSCSSILKKRSSICKSNDGNSRRGSNTSSSSSLSAGNLGVGEDLLMMRG